MTRPLETSVRDGSAMAGPKGLTRLRLKGAIMPPLITREGGMAIRAYLLIEAQAGTGNSILNELRGLRETIQADRVTGPYDLICILESDDLDKLGDIVRDTVHRIPGVSRTMSCLRFTS